MDDLSQELDKNYNGEKEGDLNFDKLDSDNMEIIHQSLIQQQNPEIISDKLIDFFSIRLSQLENSYLDKEKQVGTLMLSFYSLSQTILDLKALYPYLIMVPITKKQNYDDLNSSKMSTSSRRSQSSSRFMNNKKTESKEKFSAFSQKAQINIGGSQSHDSQLNRSILSKKGENALNPKFGKAVNSSTGFKNKTNTNTNPSNKIINIEVTHNPNIKKEDNKSKNDKTVSPLIHIKKPNQASSENSKTQKLNRKTQSDDISNKNIIQNNSGAKNSKGIVSKVEPKNEKTITKIVSTTTSVGRDTKTNSVNVNNSKNIKASYKFEPKVNKKSINFNSESNEFNETSSKAKLISYFGDDVTLLKIFNDVKYQKASTTIFKFLKFKDQMVIKGFNRMSRKMYFDYRIGEISNKIKSLEENPLKKLEISTANIEKARRTEFILNSHLNDISKNYVSIYFINLLYAIFCYDIQDPQLLALNDNYAVMRQKINSIEKFLKKNQKTLNLYEKFENFEKLIKRDTKIYHLIKEIYNEKTVYNFNDLNVIEFSPLVDVFEGIEKLVDTNNMELMIDLEIMNHNLDILKTFFENI